MGKPHLPRSTPARTQKPVHKTEATTEMRSGSTRGTQQVRAARATTQSARAANELPGPSHVSLGASNISRDLPAPNNRKSAPKEQAPNRYDFGSRDYCFPRGFRTLWVHCWVQAWGRAMEIDKNWTKTPRTWDYPGKTITTRTDTCGRNCYEPPTPRESPWSITRDAIFSGRQETSTSTYSIFGEMRESRPVTAPPT